MLFISILLLFHLTQISCIIMDFSSKRKPESYVISFSKVLLFGDSLTQKGFYEGGWCSKLVEAYARKCDFLNRGFSGYTTRISRYILSNILKEASYPEGSLYAAVVLLGTNDSVLKDVDDRAVPVDEFKENLKKILDEIEKNGILKERILLVSPPPIDVESWKKHALEMGFDQAFSNEAVSHYAAASTEVSKELQIKNLNLWTELQKFENWQQFYTDGLHFGKKGHEVVYKLMEDKLEPILKPLKLVYPDYKDIDHVHPERTLGF